VAPVPLRSPTRLRSPAEDSALSWLLAGDPAIRWQTLRDLCPASPRAIAQERRKISRQGWGARLLAKQGPDARWAAGQSSDSGLYSPKWTSTTYTMLLLRDFGLAPSTPSARAACRLLLDHGLQPDGGIGLDTWAKWTRASETCVTGMILSLASYFELEDPRLPTVARHLLDQQMPDGGWNCRRPQGATHSSVHTTITALEALRHYELHRARAPRPVQPSLAKVRAAQRRGREFLLVHRLFRSHRTGEIIKPVFLKFAFPPRWHYDILRALDHFQSVDAPRDPRLSDAIAILESTRLPDGRWALQQTYPGKTYFDLERKGAPSRWNTLRALRVLRWWNRRRV